MPTATHDIRKANNAFAWGMISTGGELLLLAIMIGGSGFLIQWGVWFIVVGWLASKVIERAAGAADWVGDKAANAWARLPSLDNRGAEYER